jgi:23S rRNA pseudouridine2605 synthase
VRLQKYLARAGVASRRKSETIIAAGRVRVDGVVITRVGTTVDPTAQTVEVDGRVVRLEPKVWWMLHKPPAVLCSRTDPDGRPTIYELLPDEAVSLFHVGRLDFLSEGLILLSSDGDTAHRLLHPSSEVRRRYEVALVGPVPGDLPTRLSEGLTLEDGPARADRARFLAPAGSERPVLELELHEGRNREVRRMMKVLEVRVQTLKRTALGPIELGELPRGAHRPLDQREVAALRAAAGLARDET